MQLASSVYTPFARHYNPSFVSTPVGLQSKVTQKRVLRRHTHIDNKKAHVVLLQEDMLLYRNCSHSLQ
jgi:hypothetical protein